MNLDIFFNENGGFHKLTGPAVDYIDSNKEYWINNVFYMKFYKNSNELFISLYLLELTPEYGVYIKQNIKDLIIEYNPKIKFYYNFYTKKCKLNKNYLKKLPNFIKDLIIL